MLVGQIGQIGQVEKEEGDPEEQVPRHGGPRDVPTLCEMSGQLYRLKRLNRATRPGNGLGSIRGPTPRTSDAARANARLWEAWQDFLRSVPIPYRNEPRRRLRSLSGGKCVERHPEGSDVS